MPFIVPGVCRFAVNAGSYSRPNVTVLDMQIDTTGGIGSRAEACEGQAGILINEWCDHILPLTSSQYTFSSVSWVDLDSATGSTGARSTTSQETLPQAGPVGGDASVPSNAMLVTKQTVSRRGARKGRIYLGGQVEANLAGPLFTGAWVTSSQAAWTSFLNNLNQDDAGITGYTSQLAVVHILTRDSEGHPLTGDWTEVTALTVNARAATQRRRLRK